MSVTFHGFSADGCVVGETTFDAFDCDCVFGGAHPEPGCFSCKGTGTVTFEHRDGVNFANGNARAVLGALGLDDDDLCGSAPVSTLLQRLMVARNTNCLSGFTRSEERRYGSPVERDGVVEMRPLRYHAFGLDEDGLRRRLDDVAGLVDRVTRLGAVEIAWG